MKIVFMGTPEFSVNVLEGLLEKHEVVLVVTQPDKLVGRKQTLEYSPVKKCALEHGLKVFQPKKIKDEYQAVLDAKPDIIITAAFGQFIPNVILEYPEYGCINVHGSLLPKYRGGSPIQTAIINGEKETGITVMYMASKMDSGNIIAQRSIPILDTDDNGSMFNKLSVLGRDLLMEVLPSIFDKTNPSIPQDETKVTYAYNISHEQQFINWNKTSKEIVNLIRGLAPNPTALTSINGTIIKVFKAKEVSVDTKYTPGEVIKLNKELLIATADGAVSILELQQSGKNKMDVKSFLNGQKILALGMVLENNIL
jgi:methionyl-tRNA formyltransferase